jgi:hypothetical protein
MVPWSEVPPKVLARLRGGLRGARIEIHLVLEEDTYETEFGDGRWLQLVAACFDLASATKRRDRFVKKNEERLQKSGATHGYAYHLKAIRIIPDEYQKQFTTDSGYSTKEIVRLLAEP